MRRFAGRQQFRDVPGARHCRVVGERLKSTLPIAELASLIASSNVIHFTLGRFLLEYD